MGKDIKEFRNISVIGAGLMGHGIAQIFAVNGYPVTLVDLGAEILDKAIENIRSNLTLMAQSGISSWCGIEASINLAVSENLELKQKIFQDLDTVCPEGTILATNTSVISITEIAQKAKIKERILGTHFWNPPYLIPLVEVIKGKETALKAMDVTFELLKGIGKHPVRINKDVPGFVGNRLQHALWREAISIVEKGIADAATVDECVKFGFGLRLPELGPLENVDMVGTDLTLAVHDYILKHLERSPDPSALLKKKVGEGDLGFKTGRGFQEWSPEEAQRSRARLQEYLLKVTKS